MYEQPGIEVRADGPVRIVTLNQPETLNAFTEDLHEQFVSLWADVERDEGIKASDIADGSFEIDIAGERVQAKVSLKPFFDPERARPLS